MSAPTVTDHSFFLLFKFIYQLTDNEESVRFAVRSVIDEFAIDGVRYLELRSTPRRCDETGRYPRPVLIARTYDESSCF